MIDSVAEHFGLDIRYEERKIGGAAIREEGEPISDETLQKASESDSVLLGAAGHPDFDDAPVRPETGLLKLRKHLGAFANLRPVETIPALADSSTLKREVLDGVDILVVRELTGGMYFGEKNEGGDYASDLCEYSREEVERVARVAFDAAKRRKRRVTSVDKSNILATSRLWRSVVEEVAEDYPEVTLDHVLVDAAAMFLIREPSRFDVILTENMFGDILSDEAAMLPGSMGMLASASPRRAGHAGHLRAGTRQRPGHRRAGQREPLRHHPFGGHDVPPLPGPPGRGRGHRSRRLDGPGDESFHPGSGRNEDHRRSNEGREQVDRGRRRSSIMLKLFRHHPTRRDPTRGRKPHDRRQSPHRPRDWTRWESIT